MIFKNTKLVWYNIEFLATDIVLQEKVGQYFGRLMYSNPTSFLSLTLSIVMGHS